MNLSTVERFRFQKILNINETQKIIYLLGSIEGQQGQAVMVLTAKIAQPHKLQFTNIAKVFINDIYGRFTCNLSSQFDIQLVFPITEKHKDKYRQKIITIHKQSGKQYQQNKQSILNRQLKHIQWVTNILEGKSQVERVLFKSDDIIILPDFKFANFKEINSLHLLVLFKNPNLHTIRDLTQDHLSLLIQTQKSIAHILTQQFQTKIQKCRIYFHYPPTFYRLHLHIMSLGLQSLSCKVERCHELSTVIQNIQIKGDYYQKICLNTFKQQKQ